MNERTLLGLQQPPRQWAEFEEENLFERVQQVEACVQQHRAFAQRQEAKLRAAQQQDALDATRLPLTSSSDACA